MNRILLALAATLTVAVGAAIIGNPMLLACTLALGGVSMLALINEGETPTRKDPSNERQDHGR